MKLAVVLPSRGLVYSQTVEELYRELESLGGSFRVFWSHGRPIPDCFNVPTEEALKGDYDYFLYVEEDMVLPEGILGRMLERVDHAIACDYPVGGSDGGTVMYDQEGRAFFTGCGLLLVRADLLRRMPKPIWRSDVRWKPWVEDGLIHFELSLKREGDVYGQQDVAFGLRLYANGLPIEVMPETIGQRELVKKGGRGSNDGFHVVRDRMKVVPRDELKHIPVRQNFQDIVIDGKRVKVPVEKFAALSEAGVKMEKPKYIKVLSAIFENEEALDGWLRLEGA